MDSRLAINSAVLLLYFVLIISIGLYMGRKEENLKDFALGGRRIPWWAVLASLIAAETSAGTFFGTPSEGFALRNYTYLQLALGTIIARILVSYIFIKPYYDTTTKFTRSTNILPPASVCQPRTPRRPCFCLHGCSRPVRDCMRLLSPLRWPMK